mgnify:CR=1 FL=1
MAVTLGSLCEKAGYLYGMRVIAGKEGMTNIVQWVHSVEDIEVSDFLHGGELSFQRALQTKVRNGCCRLSKISLPKMSADLF